MCVCVSWCVYVHTCVCMCAHALACVFLPVLVYFACASCVFLPVPVCSSVCASACVQACVSVCLCVRVCVWMWHVCVYACVCVCVSARMCGISARAYLWCACGCTHSICLQADTQMCGMCRQIHKRVAYVQGIKPGEGSVAIIHYCCRLQGVQGPIVATSLLPGACDVPCIPYVLFCCICRVLPCMPYAHRRHVLERIPPLRLHIPRTHTGRWAAWARLLLGWASLAPCVASP
jgi:hypothetical protein